MFSTVAQWNVIRLGGTLSCDGQRGKLKGLCGFPVLTTTRSKDTPRRRSRERTPPPSCTFISSTKTAPTTSTAKGMRYGTTDYSAASSLSTSFGGYLTCLNATFQEMRRSPIFILQKYGPSIQEVRVFASVIKTEQVRIFFLFIYEINSQNSTQLVRRKSFTPTSQKISNK